jgi:hypothetical protein
MTILPKTEAKKLKGLYEKRRKLERLVNKEHRENKTGYLGKYARELARLDAQILKFARS